MPDMRAEPTSSLSGLMNRSEKRDTRGPILTILQGNSHFIAQKNGKIWTEQRVLQPILVKSDRLLRNGVLVQSQQPRGRKP